MTDWRKLPKAELHCHLLGAISPSLLQRIKGKGERCLVTPSALETVYPITTLAKFRQWLEVLKPYQAASVESMRPVLAAHVDNLIEQHVVYTEIMLSPTMFPRQPRAMIRAFEQWRAWTREIEQGQIQVEYIMVLPRTLEAAVLELDIRIFAELRRAGLIVGVALVGVETGDSIERFSDAFKFCRDAGLGIEIHAGEHTGPQSIRDALAHGRPDRLGHGLSAFADPELVKLIAQSNLHIEFCPTSNVCTGAVTNLQRHPIAQGADLGVSFSINTDDPGAFGCSMESEHRLLAKTFGFGATDFHKVFQNSLAARFQPKLRYPVSSD
jgi:adenosine deaminase